MGVKYEGKFKDGEPCDKDGWKDGELKVLNNKIIYPCGDISEWKMKKEIERGVRSVPMYQNRVR